MLACLRAFSLACVLRSGQIVIMVAAVLSAFLAAVTNPKYNAIVSSVSSIIGTMMQFRGIDSKLDRYSSAAESLESILIWWQSCPDEDKKVIANIQTLVMSVEDWVTLSHPQPYSQVWVKSRPGRRMGVTSAPDMVRQRTEHNPGIGIRRAT